MIYYKYFIIDILLHFALYIGYINNILLQVYSYNISHISRNYHIFKSTKIFLRPVEWKDTSNKLLLMVKTMIYER